MPSDREIAAHADPQLEQYFLVSPEKLSKLITAAGICPTDDVLEVGAGIGTVARKLPMSRSLTVIEFDERLIGFLRQNVPHAKVMQGNALEIIQRLSFDVLIGNLPNVVTESLLKLIPRLSFRTAILAVSESTDLDQLGRAFSWSEVTRISGDDFLPPQPSVSRIMKVVPVSRRWRTVLRPRPKSPLGASATKVPRPLMVITKPSSRKMPIAMRTVPRDTPCSCCR